MLIYGCSDTSLVKKWDMKQGVSLNLDKTPQVGGILTGIKGQHLMFDERAVINIRKYGGYKVALSGE